MNLQLNQQGIQIFASLFHISMVLNYTKKCVFKFLGDPMASIVWPLLQMENQQQK